MAARGQSFAEKFSRWGVAVATLKEHLEEMPHIAEDVAAMEKFLADARALEVRQEGLRGQAREINAELRRVTREGEKVRARLRAHLQAKYGATSESVAKFGFRPARFPRRRPVVVVEEPEAPPPAEKTAGQS
jgi:hypothetical protein